MPTIGELLGERRVRVLEPSRLLLAGRRDQRPHRRGRRDVVGIVRADHLDLVQPDVIGGHRREAQGHVSAIRARAELHRQRMGFIVSESSRSGGYAESELAIIQHINEGRLHDSDPVEKSRRGKAGIPHPSGVQGVLVGIRRERIALFVAGVRSRIVEPRVGRRMVCRARSPCRGRGGSGDPASRSRIRGSTWRPSGRSWRGSGRRWR